MRIVVDILIGGAILGAVYSLIAVGLNLQYGVTRILNVAHGDFLMIGAYLTYFCVTLLGMNAYSSIVIIGPAMFIIGYLIYSVVLRRMVKTSKSGEDLEFRSLLLCFGLSFVIQNFAMAIWTANYRGYETPSLGLLNIAGVDFEMNRIVIAAISVAINVALFLVLKFTRFGVAMRATVDQPVGSQLVGINIFTVCAVSFSLGIVLAAWAGILLSILSPTINPFMGAPYTVIALVLVILAGIGSFKGNIVGGFLIGYLVYITLRVIHPSLTLVMVYGVLILVLIIKPKGLFAR
ncbi:MAG: branched-chain amino acid ABC transporter permease [Thermoleophilia bacterium]|nr:branched-chain amino acid ABC transporter permease [Thermoleophilia bacterium]